MEEQGEAPLVLVVDDDADTREMYGVVLETVGYRVDQAARLADVGRAIARGRPDVVLTDWLLPDGSGLDVCHHLQGSATTRHVPIIAATGLSLTDAQMTAARQQGCGAVLLKPIDPDAMLDAIRLAVITATQDRLRAAARRMQRYARHVRHPGAGGAPCGAVDMTDMLARAAARSGGPVALMLADDSARYVAASGTAVLTGYQPEELAALSIWDLTPPADAAQSHGAWQAFIAAGTQEGQYPLLRRDGRTVQTQYFAIANIAPGLHLSALAVASQVPASLSAR